MYVMYMLIFIYNCYWAYNISMTRAYFRIHRKHQYIRCCMDRWMIRYCWHTWNFVDNCEYPACIRLYRLHTSHLPIGLCTNTCHSRDCKSALKHSHWWCCSYTACYRHSHIYCRYMLKQIKYKWHQILTVMNKKQYKFSCTWIISLISTYLHTL